jgi:hypothetical protein
MAAEMRLFPFRQRSDNVEPAYRGLPMPLIQTRRHFLTGLSFVGAAGSLRARRAESGHPSTRVPRAGRTEGAIGLT